MSAKASRRLRTALVVVLVLAAFYAAYRYTLHRMVESKLNEIRQQGYPVTLAELDKWYPQPSPGENAADLYLKAFAQFVDVDKKESGLLPVVGLARLPLRGDTVPEDMKEAIAEYLATNEVSCHLLHEATAKSQCRYPINLTDATRDNDWLKQFQGARQGTKLLCLEAILNAQNGRSQEVVDSVMSAIRLADSLKDEPLLLPQLGRLACLEMTVGSLELAVNTTPLSGAQLRDLSGALTEAESPQSLLRGFVGILCEENQYTLGNKSLETTSADASLPALFAYQYLGLRQLDRSACFGVIGSYIRACQHPFPMRLQLAHDTRIRAAHVSKSLLLAASLGPGLELCVTHEAHCVASLRTARTALAVQAYRATNSSLPDKLENLVPAHLAAVPADPFQGQPLRYKKLATGYVVYSVGEDGKDDGGVEPGPCFGPGTDITFIVGR
jgi:hypothetical protein